MSEWQRRSDTRDPLTILCEREGVPCSGCRYYLEIAGEKQVDVDSAENHEVTVVVRVPPESAKTGANTIYFDIKAMDDAKVAVHEKASFLMQ